MRKSDGNTKTPLMKPAKELSMQHLAKISALIDTEQHRTTNIQKQIKNEVSLARKNDGNIFKNISRISNEGQLLASRYEEQRDKFTKLEALVRNVEEQLYREKAEQAQDMKMNVETDKLVEHTNILNDKEKVLEKVLEKSNTASYDLSKKEDTIRALRSERTIVSALFDKIERQLCSLEHCYKVLVIERKRQEDLLEHSVQEFNQIHANGHRHISKLALKNDQAREKQMEQVKSRKTEDSKILARLNTEVGQERRASLFGATLEDTSHISNRQSIGNQPILTHQRSTSDLQKEKQRAREKMIKLEHDTAKVRHEKCVKKIFNDLGISNTKELPSNIEEVEKKNQELLGIAQQLYQQIVQAQKQIQRIAKGPSKRALPSLRRTRLSRKQTCLQNYMESISRNRRQLQQFRSVCRVVIERARQTQNQQQPLPSQFLNEEQEITFYMAELEKFFENSYQEPAEAKKRKHHQPGQPKALNCLLNSTRDHQDISIYEEQDLLEFARKNIQKMHKS